MNVILKDEKEERLKKAKKQAKKTQSAKGRNSKTAKKRRPKKIQTPRERTALALGCFALGLSILGVAALLFVSHVVGIVLGGLGVALSFASLFCGKGGTLPAVVAMIAGFLTILSAVVTMRLS